MNNKLFGKTKAKISISKRMVLLYVLLVLLPACTLIYIYYTKSSAVIEKEVTESILQTLKQSEINISDKLDNIEYISDEIFMDKRVQDFVGDENDNDINMQLDQEEKIKNTLISLTNKTDDYRIRIFVSNKKIISNEKVNFFSVEDVKNRKWYGQVTDKKGGILWTGVYRENYMDSGEEYVVSCARVLKHTLNYDANDGVLLVDIPERNIEAILSTLNIGDSREVFLADSEGRVISYWDKDKLGSVILDTDEIRYVDNSSYGIKNIKKDGRDFFLIHQTIDTNGWKLIAEVDSKDIIKTNTFFNNISTFIYIIISIIMIASGIFLMFAYAMDNMNKQVKKIINSIKKEGVEVVEGDIKGYQGDLTMLEKNVYNIIQKVKNLMQEIYQAKINEKEARLKALQAQINPHFLYNTLDAINWMALKINAADISSMVNSLARYFRLSLSKGRSIVTIKEELELIKVYLNIQQYRFKGAIKYKFDIEDGVEDYYIYKLLLQPIIENAIIHGIQKKKDRSGMINVEARKVGDDIVIEISDDGVGMAKETIARVLDSDSADKQNSYGLYNVNERIKLHFGNDYGVKIYSKIGTGTKVELRIKAMKNIK
ncbi:MAG TPA: hypothetical protein DD426_10070 [Clostridiaceae bacterium]|nr:hypothetical protein [Clostridiaceae bacterium]